MESFYLAKGNAEKTDEFLLNDNADAQPIAGESDAVATNSNSLADESASPLEVHQVADNSVITSDETTPAELNKTAGKQCDSR